MIDNFLARMLLRWGYRTRSLAANERQFSAAAADISAREGMRLDEFGVAGAILHTPGTRRARSR